MLGGSGGGGGAAGGGAGGGVIQLSAAESIEIAPSGSILADGGPGAASGGGGSGGAILLSAPEISIKGQLSVRGGRGGGGGKSRSGGGGGGGRIALFFTQSFSGVLPEASKHAAGGQTAGERGGKGQAGTVIPMPSLAWWRLDAVASGGQGKVVADSMGQSHAMLWHLDEKALVPGVAGRGLQFDGEMGYLEVYGGRDPLSGLGRGEMTLAMWVKTEVLADKAVVIGKGMPMVPGGELLEKWRRAGYGKRFAVQKRGEQIVFAVEDGSRQSQVAVAADQVETGQWVHLAAVRRAEPKQLALFVNGQELAESADSTADVSTRFNLYIGAGEDGAVKNHGRVAIDDVRIFATALDGDTLSGLIDHAATAGHGQAAGASVSEVPVPVQDEPWNDPDITTNDRKAIEREWRKGNRDKAWQLLAKARQRAARKRDRRK